MDSAKPLDDEEFTDGLNEVIERAYEEGISTCPGRSRSRNSPTTLAAPISR